MATDDPRINLKIKFDGLNDIDGLLVAYIDAGKFQFELVMTREEALEYILNLRIASTEPRERNILN